jgi:hypothetical protein
MRLLILLTLMLAGPVSSEIIIIHEKLAGANWVLAYSVVNDTAELNAKVVDIEVDPAKRLGDNFAVYGGIRLTVVSTQAPPVSGWSNAPKSAILVFWAHLQPDGTLSLDPKDYFIDEFVDLESARAFVQSIQDDPTKSLYDKRPFQATDSYALEVTPGPTTYTLVAP